MQKPRKHNEKLHFFARFLLENQWNKSQAEIPGENIPAGTVRFASL